MKTKMILALLLAVLLNFAGYAQWSTSGSDIYNTNAGNVGIGTTTPTGKLEILGPGASSADNLVVKNNSSSVIRVYGTGDAEYYMSGFLGHRSRGTLSSPTSLQAGDRVVAFGANGYMSGAYRGLAAIEMFAGSTPGASSFPGYIVFQTTANAATSRVERMRIAESGNVGIGTTTPSYLLDVNGSARVGSLSYYSDERFKENIKGIEGSLNRIVSLSGYSYTFNSQKFKSMNFPKGQRLGLLAQQVQKVFPEVVSTDANGYLAVDYISLIPVMLEAIKELKSQLDATKEFAADKITTPQTEISDLRQKGIALRNYPNPASHKSIIEYTLQDNSTRPSIVIYDFQGKQVKMFSNLEQAKGQLEIDTSNLESGVYFYSLVTNGEIVLTKKMIVSK